MAVIFIAAFGTMAAVPDGKTADPPFPTALFLMFPLFWLIMTGGFAISLILGISYCLKAMRREWAGYPIIGRWADKIVRT